MDERRMSMTRDEAMRDLRQALEDAPDESTVAVPAAALRVTLAEIVRLRQVADRLARIILQNGVDEP